MILYDLRYLIRKYHISYCIRYAMYFVKDWQSRNMNQKDL